MRYCSHYCKKCGCYFYECSNPCAICYLGMTGPTGAQGLQGDIGPTGAQGLQGDMGPTGAQGLQGDMGPTGEQGLQGDMGPTGAQGLQGDMGPTGVQGLQGDTGPTGEQGLQGDIGPTGSQGLQGDMGPTGVQGLQGDMGPTGSQGLQGDMGPTGEQGLQGDIGPTGPQGSLILSAATFFSTSIDEVPFASAIPIDSGARIVGSGITLINVTDIIIENPGMYLVAYYFQGDPIGDIETIACSLWINGVIVPGSIIQSVASFMNDEVEPAVSNTCIVEISDLNTVLQIYNSSSSAISHIRWIEGFCSASITILRLS